MNKFIVVASILVLAVQGDELKSKDDIKQKLMTLSKSCMIVTEAPKDADRLLKDVRLMTTNEAELCYLECIYRGMGMILDGEYNVMESKDLAKIRFTDPKDYELAIKGVDYCKDIVKKEEGYKCGLAYSLRKCYVEYGQKNEFFPEVL